MGISKPVSYFSLERSNWIWSNSALSSVDQLEVAAATLPLILRLPNTVPTLSVKQLRIPWEIGCE